MTTEEVATKRKKKITIKVGLVGDSQIGKTSFMVKYVEGNYNEDYIQTLGVTFMEKTIMLKNIDVVYSIWDLGGQLEFGHMLPLVSNDAVAVFFVFDLTRKATLTSIKQWYRQVRTLNKTASAFLIGTKYDLYIGMDREAQMDILKSARKFAKIMKAPLVFSSSSHSINVQKIFKILLSQTFELKCNVKQLHDLGDPIVEYEL